MTRLNSSPILLVVDMQNGFCHPSGSFSKVGIPILRQAAIFPVIKRLIDLCRRTGIPVFYTRMEFSEDFSDAGIMIDGKPGLKQAKALIRGTWDAQILDELRPEPYDFVVSKQRHSAFFGTDLHRVLSERGIDQIIVTGVATNICVESTVRDAWMYGFQSLTVQDATDTLSEKEHLASIINLQHFGGTISSRELEEELQKWSLLNGSNSLGRTKDVEEGSFVA
ncbi:hypothetical protein sscle_03g031840 [Sclerotinia sclerotiorum 1980 UF-70]|uniref:Isochorismatase-like domain-containing protein n=1 Tax=Sclerotinia sclerotiorum (strain ATCC 18683 / 1980 / Ss-1) TaxID=665079 RepID=A0A1D9Q0D3_SCLS1|nr:hypothetical protein sscle_03g031840 [Sclerotinia sclerotiorum 1980 UF-70]